MESTPVTYLIPKLLESQREDALDQLWRLYGNALTVKARAVLRDLPDTNANAEEAAMSAFMRFAERAKDGKLVAVWPTDRNSLKQLLLNAARDRARDLKRKALLEKQRMLGSVDAKTVPVEEDRDAQLIAEEVIEYLRAQLPEKVFIAGTLRFADVSCKDIALSQSVGERTIERRVTQFKECLATYGRDGDDAG